MHRLPADSRQIDKAVNNAVPLGQKLVHAVAESYNIPPLKVPTANHRVKLSLVANPLYRTPR
jgi:hypothetical protein